MFWFEVFAMPPETEPTHHTVSHYGITGESNRSNINYGKAVLFNPIDIRGGGRP